jgi:hypothetical protein
MNNDTPFPFHTTKEAWDYFTKAARMHFAKLVRQVGENKLSIRSKLKFLKNRDYCARLLYVLNMFAFEGDHEGEFDLDWAMLLAKPLSAAQARQSIQDLTELGLMGTLELDIEDEQENMEQRRLLSDGKKRTPPTKSGGDTSSGTKFNFDE